MARGPVRVYLTGGSTAVIEGWRETTIDVDLRFEPDLYRYPAIDPPVFRQKLDAALG